MSTPDIPPPPPLTPPSGSSGFPPQGPPAAPAPGPAQGTWEPQYLALPPAPPPEDAGEARRKAGTALGWAIAGVVTAGLALVAAVVALLLAVGAMGGSGGLLAEPLRGEVVGLPDGSDLSGDRLVRVLDNLLRDWGATDVAITCPDTAGVTVSTVVVCRGQVDGYDWTGAVFFEDSAGRFVVAEF